MTFPDSPSVLPTRPRVRRWLRSSVLPSLLLAWWFTTPASAALGYCEQVCDYNSKCNGTCLINYDDPSSCGEYGVCYEPGYCGDGFCGLMDGESVTNCAADCFIGPGPTPPPDEPTCGSFGCELGESSKSCPADCSPNSPITCGDGACEAGETANNCSADCTYTDYCQDQGDCPSGYSCRARRCVWDSHATACHAFGGGIECGSNEKCAQLDEDTGYGICIPYF